MISNCSSAFGHSCLIQGQERRPVHGAISQGNPLRRRAPRMLEDHRIPHMRSHRIGPRISRVVCGFSITDTGLPVSRQDATKSFPLSSDNGSCLARGHIAMVLKSQSSRSDPATCAFTERNTLMVVAISSSMGRPVRRSSTPPMTQRIARAPTASQSEPLRHHLLRRFARFLPALRDRTNTPIPESISIPSCSACAFTRARCVGSRLA